MFYAQKKTDHDTVINVINGNIITKGSPIVKFSSWKGSSNKYPGNRKFDISFENVTFSAASGASPAVLIATAVRNLSEPLTYGNMTLTNCTIDLTGITSGTIFDFADASGIIRASANVVGGKIIADGFDGITIANLAKTYNSLTFAKNTSGAYTTLYLKGGAITPSETLSTAEGEMAFVRTSETEGDYVICKLSDSALNEFKPKISVTLYSDFIFNIYIPATADVESIEFCGEAVDMSAITPVTVEGKEYYAFRKLQAPSAAAEDFSFRVGIKSGSKTVYGNWTVSIVKYAKLVLNDTDSTAVEKTLVKDILSYVRSAYIYFECANAAEIKQQIDAIIGADYDATSLPDTSKEAAEVGGGFDSATFRLDAKPSFIFYPETDKDGNLVYDLSVYKFTQGGKLLEKEIGSADGRTYIKISTYAYQIAENVSYSVEGTEIEGEFNIKSYYEFAKTQNDDTLVNIVERLWKYSESAAAYKAEVTSAS